MATLRCTNCSETFALSSQLQRCEKCNEPLEIAYDDLSLTRSDLTVNTPLVTKYRRVLPLKNPDADFSLGEGETPLVKANQLSRELGIDRLYLKNESTNPTGSFKDRGTSVEVQRALSLGKPGIATVSTGNMAASVAAYAANANLSCFIFVKSDIAMDKVLSVMIYGPGLLKISGDYADLVYSCQKLAEGSKVHFTYGDTPFRIEGQKTIAYEICEQLDFNPPEYIVVPVSSGGNFSAIIKGLREMVSLGIISDLPQVVGVQAEGAAPIVNAFEQGKEKIDHLSSTNTLAHAISNPYPSSGNRVLKELRSGSILGLTVSDDEILQAQRSIARKEGIFCQPASAAAVAGVQKLIEGGSIKSSSRVVAIITGNGFKDIQVLKEHDFPTPKQVDLRSLEEAFYEFVYGDQEPGGR